MNINVAWGTTRFVVLLGPYAFKFARFRFVHACIRLINRAFSGTVTKRLHDYDRKSSLCGGFKYLMYGVYSNLNEFTIYKESHHPRLVPTLFTFFGVVNIQVRGERAREKDLLVDNPFMCLKEDPLIGKDVILSANFSILQGKVCLHDYGNEALRSFLF